MTTALDPSSSSGSRSTPPRGLAGPHADSEPPARLVALFASAAGLTVASLYYAQPLIGLVAHDLGVPRGFAGFLVTLTQVGYGAGLLFVVPLADLLENRRLVVSALIGVVLGLAGVASAGSALLFFAASFVVGIAAVATQVLVPFVTHLTPERARGKIVGNVLGGLLAGIVLARPFASFVAASFGWRAVFGLAGAAVALLALVLHRALPERRPVANHSYREVLASLVTLYRTTPVLRRRAFYQAMMFGAFNTFWTGSSLLLGDTFGYGQRAIGLFALAGAAGVLVAPIAGRLADRGFTRLGTGLALVAALLSFGLVALATRVHAVSLLVLAAVVLDAAVQVCQVLSMRSLYVLAPEIRGRLNGLFMGTVFVVGAVSSASSVAIYARAGAPGLAAFGGSFVLLALVGFARER